MEFKKILIYGAGSWGTALACHFARIDQRREILLYTENPRTLADINNHHINSIYLNNIPLSQNIRATNDIHHVKDSELIIIAVPSKAFSTTIDKLKNLSLHTNTLLLIATKGISLDPIELMSTKIQRDLTSNFLFIAGPNLACEVAKNLYSSTTIAANDITLINTILNNFSTENFEMISCNDIITIQIASIVKNILAIKSGIMLAKKEGENTKATLITNSLREIEIISIALGGKSINILQPAIIGDLILTNYSSKSRNIQFGYEFHRSNYSRKFLLEYPKIVEGVEASKAIRQLLKTDLNIPIINSVVSLICDYPTNN
ncbi:NAD(P)H-dependent glycerol-3-phosphate dehydrogenase [Rickettsia endosymbiont of Cardiosporidium cionae]|uniref:NAD(P)H-dependent glycerol-3-phosphate dehydrogenase n=1 Tax=Rickettsia endosymbiont of Cardiosporidium cionae TaxID=2777155 RepID=UPI0018940AE6|nr:NAD(P)H-dependent glycerol-3-phosphate dehydrogenase [Rickettsia endosymbiont of Cardiosporidium cionae]KAF8818355.1 NAD(P)H-dependent glycerol-3-phosphate dehydrogenase [Rickettsia endosymbiont of Cardiosporidium cionae]